MKRLTSTSFAAIAAGFLAFSAPANATDLLDGLNDPAPQGTAVNWSGFYLGGAIGYGNSNHELSVQDYFKDFCSDNVTDVDFNPFETVDRIGTLGNRVAREDDKNGAGTDAPDWVSCDGIDQNWLSRTVPVETFSNVPGDSREVATLNGLNSSGIIGDVRAGADFAQGRFLFGVFGSYAFSQMEASGSGFGAFESFTLDKGDEWSVGGRAGYIVAPSTLLYALAAYTQTDYEFAGVFDGDPFSKDTTFDGVTVGGGIEFAVSSNVFLGIEGTHTFYGEETIFDNYNADKNVGTSIVDDLDETKVMGTLKIKINSF